MNTVTQTAGIAGLSISHRLIAGGLAFFIGMTLLFGVGIAFIREHLDASWRSELDVERALDLPVLGGVPDVGRRPARRTVYG